MQEILSEFADVVDEQQSDSENDDSGPPPAKHAATASVPGSTASGSGGGGGGTSHSLVAPAFGGGMPATAPKKGAFTWGGANLDAVGPHGLNAGKRSSGCSDLGGGGFAAPRSWNAVAGDKLDGGQQPDSIEQYKSSLDNGKIASSDALGGVHSQPAAGGAFGLGTSGGGPMPLPETKADHKSRTSPFTILSPMPTTPAAPSGAAPPKVAVSSAGFGSSGGGSGSGMGFRDSRDNPLASQTAGPAKEDAAVWKQIDGSVGRASSPGGAQAATSGSGGSCSHAAFGDSSKKLPDFPPAFAAGGTATSCAPRPSPTCAAGS